MPTPPLTTPGHDLPRHGLHRPDLIARLITLAVAAVATPIAIWSLWLAGQLGALLTDHTWPATPPGAAPGIALRLLAHTDQPADAWPTPAGDHIPTAGLLYPIWALLFTTGLATAGAPVLITAKRIARRRGFITRTQIRHTLSAQAVLARIDIVRPGLTIHDTDDPTTAATKHARRNDPLEVGRFLGHDIITGQPLYLANEYTLLAAAAARFGNKTTRYVIPRVIDARGAVLTTSTRLDVAETTFTLREHLGPTHIFEPQGEIPGVPRLRWSPIEGAEDPIIAMLRANGFAAGSGIGDESVENGKWFKDQAATIIRGLLHAAALDEHATMTNALAWSQNPTDTRPEKILRHHGVHSWADRLTRHRETTGRARDTIQSVVAGALDAFNDPRVLHACSPPRGQQPRTTDWLHESGTLYLVGTRDAQALIAPLLSALCEDVLYHAKRAALTAPGGRVEPCLYFIGDEIANIAPIQSLPSLMTEGGGSGIAVDIYTQNTQQLQDRWGRVGGKAIDASANARLLIGGSPDADGLRDAQTLAGQIRDLTTANTISAGRTTVNEHTRREHLLDIGQLRTLPAGRAIALIGNLPPVELSVPAWFERPDAAALTAHRDAFRTRLSRAA